MPYNPDDLMIQCEGCSDWWVYTIHNHFSVDFGLLLTPLLNVSGSSGLYCYHIGSWGIGLDVGLRHILLIFWFRFHPTCVDMIPEEAERLDHFYCLNCSPENKNKLHNSRASTRETDVKVINSTPMRIYLTIHCILCSLGFGQLAPFMNLRTWHDIYLYI